MQAGGGDGGNRSGGDGWPFGATDPGAQDVEVEFAQTHTPPPEEVAAAAAKRADALRGLLKQSLARDSACLVEVDRRSTPVSTTVPSPPGASPKRDK